MARSKEGQERHDAEVLRRGQEAANLGWQTIFVDLPSYQKPLEIDGFIPDVYCLAGFEELIIEVETSDSLNSDHSTKQHAAFRKWTNENPKLRKFQVIVI